MANVVINFRKPLFKDKCYINQKDVDTAIKLGVNLEIHYNGQVFIKDPKEWKAKNDVMKKVFRYPNNPMILLGGYLSNVQLPVNPKKVVPSQKGLF